MLVYKQNMKSSKFIIVNITWNRDKWRSSAYINPKAGHRYVRESPGHESLNFDFNKKGLNDEKHVFGYAQLRGYPRRFEEPGVIFFFTKNLDKNQNEIVGVYGNAEMVKSERLIKRKESGNGSLSALIKAEKEKSILFPIYLDADMYSEGKRLVPQSGLVYISQELATKMITDEIEILKKTGKMTKEEDKLYLIFELITGNNHVDYDNRYSREHSAGLENDE